MCVVVVLSRFWAEEEEIKQMRKTTKKDGRLSFLLSFAQLPDAV
jgi:hypothetical protein